MLAFRTTIFFIGWIVGTMVFGFAAVPLLLSQRMVWVFNAFWVRFTLLWLHVSVGLRTEVMGAAQTALVGCKHQSAWDTIVLCRHFYNPVFVLKRELYWIPIFGWFLWRSGQIAINRRDGRNAYDQIAKQAPALLAQGRTMIMFPEGTRVRVGDKKPYRTGIARVSTMLNLPVTPAALNAGLFWPKYTLLKRPGKATLKFLPPIPVCGNDATEWMKQVEAAIEEETAALVSEASRPSQP